MRAKAIGMSFGALIGGAVVAAIGVGLMILPQIAERFGGTAGTAFLEAADPLFLQWLRVLGIITLVQGIYQMVTFFLRGPGVLGRIIRVGDAIGAALGIPLMLWLRSHVEIIPLMLIQEDGRWSTVDLPEIENVVQWVLLFIAIALGLGVLGAIVRVFIPSREDREALRDR